MLSAPLLNVNRKPHRTLVLFPGSLGDTICALPALEALARTANEGVVIAARGEAFELCTAFSFIESVVSLEGQLFSQLFLDFQQIEKATRDFFLSFSDVVSWYGHAQRKVVENLLLLSREHLRSFPFFTGQEDCHAVWYYLQCVKEAPLRCPSLRLPQSVIQWQELFWRQHWESSSQILLIHPGSGGKKKRWQSEGFRQVAQWWRQRKKDGHALILLGPAEEHEAKEWRAVGETVTKLSLVQIAALLSRAELYLGNDSGVSHLAGAMGARGIVLFGPTEPQKWRPLGGSLSVMQNTAYRNVFPSIQGISVEEISVEEVIAGLIVLGG
jgi:ADP-heptose:LPS heptosyltransferase